MNLTKKQEEDLRDAYEALEDLEKLIQERITENVRMKEQGMVEQATHAFMLYRSKIWEAKYKIRPLI